MRTVDTLAAGYLSYLKQRRYFIGGKILGGGGYKLILGENKPDKRKQSKLYI